MDHDSFLRSMQKHVARAAIPTSAVRGTGNAGVIEPSRDFLGSLQLRAFSTQGESAFARVLDQATNALLREFPTKARRWGVARKVVNLFLRDAVNSRYLCAGFRLQGIESFLELPLDRITMANLRSKDASLPKPIPIRDLTPRFSATLQRGAAQVAASKGIARVHLDLIWWGERK